MTTGIDASAQRPAHRQSLVDRDGSDCRPIGVADPAAVGISNPIAYRVPLWNPASSTAVSGWWPLASVEVHHELMRRALRSSRLPIVSF